MKEVPAFGRTKPCGRDRAGARGQGEPGPLAKDGEKLMACLEAGHMVSILSKNEVLYALSTRGCDRCFIHPLGAEEGRQKAFPMDEEHRAVIKNLANLADQLFEIQFGPDMHPMGVMVAAEQGHHRVFGPDRPAPGGGS